MWSIQLLFLSFSPNFLTATTPQKLLNKFYALVTQSINESQVVMCQKKNEKYDEKIMTLFFLFLSEKVVDFVTYIPMSVAKV